MTQDLSRRLLRCLVAALVAAILREHRAIVEEGRQTDLGYDDCPVCLAARGR